MTDILEQIDEYVPEKIKSLNESQLATLRALLFAGYRGERDYILLELLKNRGESEITHSELTESYSYSFEKETAQYSRIKPEFFRAVRKHLSGK
jgi:hypothetical protein